MAVAPLVAFATVSDADLQREYGSKILTLRHFYAGEHLRFDCGGNLIGTASPGTWTVEGQLRAHKVSLAGSVIHISGERVFSFYDDETKQMRDIASLSKNEAKAKQLRKDVAQWASHNGKVEVDIDCGQAPADMAEVAQFVSGVFLAPQDPLADVVPSFWKPWLQRDSSGGLKKQQPGIFKVGGAITPPKAISAPDPQYSTIAKAAHYQATTVLWMVVNASGTPENIRIAKPAGLGLDEQAILVVRDWRFDPATKDGQPVAVQINVEVNFRLY